MLYQALLLFIGVHITLWIIGVLKQKGGFILVALTILFFTMTFPILFIVYPQAYVVNGTAKFTLHAFTDPSLTMIQFVLMFWYVWSYWEITDFGWKIEERGGF